MFFGSLFWSVTFLLLGPSPKNFIFRYREKYVKDEARLSPSGGSVNPLPIIKAISTNNLVVTILKPPIDTQSYFPAPDPAKSIADPRESRPSSVLGNFRFSLGSSNRVPIFIISATYLSQEPVS